MDWTPVWGAYLWGLGWGVILGVLKAVLRRL